MTDGRFTSLRRSDVSGAIYRSIQGKVETIFGDSIAAIQQDGEGCHISFDHAAPRDVDLVIGADGLHSHVRALAFGPEADYEHFLGYYVAAVEVEGYRPRDELVYVSHTRPGRQISRFAMRDDRTLFLFVFREEPFSGEMPEDDSARRAVLRKVFMDVGWEAPKILDAIESAEGIYFDSVSQIRMPSWSKGRVALIGDAAACVSLLAGEGTGLAIGEAYVLAGELHRAGGDYSTAFARYEEQLKPFLRKKQESAAKFASSFAPQTSLGVSVRNWAMSAMKVPFVADFLIGRDLRDDIELPHYEDAA